MLYGYPFTVIHYKTAVGLKSSQRPLRLPLTDTPCSILVRLPLTAAWLYRPNRNANTLGVNYNSQTLPLKNFFKLAFKSIRL